MGTNNFTFQNICVVVHEDGMEHFDSDINYWRDCLTHQIIDFTAENKPTWTRQGAYILGDVSFYRGNGDLYATIYITYKSGYYDSACLDYVTEFEDENTKIKRLNLAISKRENRIKQVLRRYGTEILKVGQFSNGEAVYKRAE